MNYFEEFRPRKSIEEEGLDFLIEQKFERVMVESKQLLFKIDDDAEEKMNMTLQPQSISTQMSKPLFTVIAT